MFHDGGEVVSRIIFQHVQHHQLHVVPNGCQLIVCCSLRLRIYFVQFSSINRSCFMSAWQSCMCRLGTGTGARGDCNTSGRSGSWPQTPVLPVPRLALGSGGRIASATDILAVATTAAAASSAAATTSGCPPSGRLASGRTSSRLGSTPKGQSALSASQAASPPVAASPTRGGTSRNRQPLQARGSLDLPRQAGLAGKEVRLQGSGGLSQALQDFTADAVPFGARRHGSADLALSASLDRGQYSVATPTAAPPHRAPPTASGGASDCSATAASDKAPAVKAMSAEPASPPEISRYWLAICRVSCSYHKNHASHPCLLPGSAHRLVLALLNFSSFTAFVQAQRLRLRLGRL